MKTSHPLVLTLSTVFLVLISIDSLAICTSLLKVNYPDAVVDYGRKQIKTERCF